MGPILSAVVASQLIQSHKRHMYYQLLRKTEPE